MRRRLASYSGPISALGAALLGVWAPFSMALEDSRLWLPANYNRLFLDLKEAALAAESLERCVTVLQGTIDLDESTEQHPIYRILCRQENGRSYNELVDGVSFKTLTTKVVNVDDLSAEEFEALRLAEAEKLRLEKEAQYHSQWLRCEAAIEEKVVHINDVRWLSELPVRPRELSGGATEFLMEFDAKSIQGLALKYYARCQFLPDGELNTKIYPRK